MPALLAIAYPALYSRLRKTGIQLDRPIEHQAAKAIKLPDNTIFSVYFQNPLLQFRHVAGIDLPIAVHIRHGKAVACE